MKVLKLIRVSLQVVIISYFFVACNKNTVSTSNHATLEKIHFVELPKSARNIKFWDDGNNQIVVFECSEEEFLKAFSGKFQLNEIKSHVSYTISGFGNSQSPPYINGVNASAVAGVYYEKIEQDGGGLKLVFDRIRNIGYFNHASW